MARINRRSRSAVRPRRSRAHTIELLIGPYGDSLFETEKQRQAEWQALRSELSAEFASVWHVATDKPRDFSGIAEQYARDVTGKKLRACRYVRLACQRHLTDLERTDWKYTFDRRKADRACRFIELLPHTKGQWFGRSERMHLESWQVFIVCVLFGWVKIASGLRRFNVAYVAVPRKNGKSQLVSCIGLYLLCADQEYGAEVYSGATNEDQAFEVFRPAQLMMQQSHELRRVLGVKVRPKQITVLENNSLFEPVVGKPGDGASPHGAIVDEYHEHATDTLYDTLKTGMGAREQPIALVITTAGTNLTGPCMLMQADIVKMLEGVGESEDVFGIIYTIDDPDAWTSEDALAEANPNLGVSVSLDYLIGELQSAIAKARKQGVFKTKYLNLWVGALAAYFNREEWKKLGDPTLKIDDFAGCPAACAIDLATQLDFVARATGFKKVVNGKEHYYVFMALYLPEAQAKSADKQHYHDWVKGGHIHVIPGPTVDFERIQDETAEECRRVKAREIAFDPWNAIQLATNIETKTNGRTSAVKVPQTVAYLSAPMKELEALIANGRIHHQGNPVMDWMIGNVYGKEDVNENVLPQKEPNRPQNKIDGPAALIMLISRLMVAGPKKSVYSERGLLRLG